MATNQKLIELAYKKLGYGDSTESNATNDGMDELQLLMGDLEGQDIIVGYNFDGDITDETGFDRVFDSAIVSILAFRLAENLRLPISSSLSAQMNAGTNVLYKRTLQNPTWKHPNRMPRGSGSNKFGFSYDRYYNNQANSYIIEREDQYFVTLADAATYTVNAMIRESGDHTLSFSVNGVISDGEIEYIEYLRPDEVTWRKVDDSNILLTSLKDIKISDAIESYRFKVINYTGGAFTLTITDKINYQAYPTSPNANRVY
jgi:hypothetical protein